MKEYWSASASTAANSASDYQVQHFHEKSQNAYEECRNQDFC